MAQKTPAELVAATTVQSGDLFMTWRPTGPGPLKSLTYDILRDTIGSDFLPTTGGSLSGALGIIAGTEGSPGLFFVGDPDTGIYRVGANELGIVAGGVQRARVTSAGVTSLGFFGPLTGDVTGNVTGNLTGNVTGNVSGSAATLTTTRSISATGDATWTVNFNGSADVTAALTIANDAVTYAKMQNVSAASRLLGRGSSGGSGNVEDITLGTGLSMSGTALSAAAGVLTLISSAASTSGSTVAFTSIAATYKRLWIIGIGLSTNNNSTNVQIDVSTNNGGAYTDVLLAATSATSGQTFQLVTHIDNYAATTGVGWGESNVVGASFAVAGASAQAFAKSAAINAVRVNINSDTFDAGTIYLYGET